MVDFTYLGRTVIFNNNNWADLYKNTRKSQQRWGMVEKVLTKTVSMFWEW